MKKTIEIPEGNAARIEGNKVILEPKESEDERIRKELVYFIQKEKEYMESKVKLENSPKLMFLMDACAYLERQKEQQPAEWSEEDEKMLASFLHKVEVCDLLTNKENVWIVKRLKALRPQPHWKPSEEQMWALDVALENFYDQNDKAALNSLKIDLQKL